ncbi:UDP-glucose 4-epimerase [Amylibacter ulvae]|uniref:UDP-glucose 4-epimerase n=1 Tax=Paramylibacter ulvae TaxID=1651968 RepID=A0ABQ3CY45_9RHOB|nr:NAD-dependent epimerase/dehydratase family protein [Amylibacter ulvae]GHA47587.1 UDP-glucose 4-epimerase [Amylibacter ulvae]
MTAPLNVAYSGANGFVGKCLGGTLQNHRKTIAPIALARTGSKSDRRCPDLINCDVLDWQTALQGADVYIHLAAYLPFGNQDTPESEKLLHVANCQAAVTALNGFALAGGRKMIFVSSLLVNGATSGATPFKWNDTPKPENAYARSKLDAENALIPHAKSLGVELMILRPPLIYGANVTGKFRTLIEHIKAEKPLPFKNISNSRDMIGLRNFCDILVMLSRQFNAIDKPILLCDRAPISTPDLIEKIAKAYGVPSRLINIPKLLFLIAKRIPIVGAAVRRLTNDVRVDDQILRDNCDWEPRFTIDDEMAAIAQADKQQLNS